MNTRSTRSRLAHSAYLERFGPPPAPASINPDYVTEVLEEALKRGTAVPDDFDWWDYLPPGAVACASPPTPQGRRK